MTMRWTVEFLDLSDDILLILFEFIQLDSLGHLCATCKRLHALVNENGWSIYYEHSKLKCSVTCPSLSAIRSAWSSYESLKYDRLTERSWKELSFISRPLSSAWPKDSVPSVACSNSHIIYGVGQSLYFFSFTRPAVAGQSPGIHFQSKYTIQGPGQGVTITGLTYYAPNSTLIASFDDGSVMNIPLPGVCAPNEISNEDGTSSGVQALSSQLLYKAQDSVECLSTSSEMCLTISLRGDVYLYNLMTGAASNLSLGFRWNGSTSALLFGSNPRYAAFGKMDPVPLRIHSISESNILSTPSLALGRTQWDEPTGSPEDSSNIGLLIRARRSTECVMVLSDPPPYFGSSGQMLASGWVDGVVRIYDLRDSRRLTPSEIVGVGRSSTKVPTLAPVMSMHDRRSRGIGSLTTGGGAGAFVAASSATGNLISFWDVRSPRNVWSVDAPMSKDPGPRYALAMESSRLFGATPRRPFVYDFGPGVTSDTYDTVKLNKADGLQLLPNGLGYTALRSRSYNEIVVD